MNLTYFKKAYITVGLVFCIFFCAGCGMQTTNVSNQNTESLLPPIHKEQLSGELVVYLEAVYADELVHYPILTAIKAFEEEYPQIHVQLESPVGGISDFEAREADITRINTEILAGNGPDVFLFGPRFTDCNLFPDLQKAMRSGVFLDCIPELKRFGIDCKSEEFWQTVLEAGRIAGHQYILPLSFDVTTALANTDILDQSGFDCGNAVRNISAFTEECDTIWQQNHKWTTYVSSDLLDAAAFDPMNYDDCTVDFVPLYPVMELSRKVQTEAPWNQGQADFLNDTQQSSGRQDTFRWKEAKRLLEGERLMDVALFSVQNEMARSLTSLGGTPKFLPVPNEIGGVTAKIDSYAAIRANSSNKQAAAALLAFLLQKDWQDQSAYPSILCELPVRKESLGASLDANFQFQKNIWWLDSEITEEEKRQWEQSTGDLFHNITDQERHEYLQSLGEPLSQDAVQDLFRICELINAAHLNSLWYQSISLGQDPSGDNQIRQVYEAYCCGEVTADELIQRLTPRLQLYLDE